MTDFARLRRWVQMLTSERCLLIVDTPEKSLIWLFSRDVNFRHDRPTYEISSLWDQECAVAVDEQTRVIALVVMGSVSEFKYLVPQTGPTYECYNKNSVPVLYTSIKWIAGSRQSMRVGCLAIYCNGTMIRCHILPTQLFSLEVATCAWSSRRVERAWYPCPPKQSGECKFNVITGVILSHANVSIAQAPLILTEILSLSARVCETAHSLSSKGTRPHLENYISSIAAPSTRVPPAPLSLFRALSWVPPRSQSWIAVNQAAYSCWD